MKRLKKDFDQKYETLFFGDDLVCEQLYEVLFSTKLVRSYLEAKRAQNQGVDQTDQKRNDGSENFLTELGHLRKLLLDSDCSQELELVYIFG